MNAFTIFLAMIFEPARGFRLIIKNRERFRWYVPVLMYLFILASHILSIFLTHYPMAAVHPEDANLLMESAKLLVPLLSLSISCFLVTTISDGESKLREVITAFAFAMVPYGLVTLLLSGASHLMSLSSAGLYFSIQTVMWVWVAVLALISISVMNTYTLGQTIRTVLLSLFTCVFLWVVLFLLFILGQRLYTFIETVIQELRIHVF